MPMEFYSPNICGFLKGFTTMYTCLAGTYKPWDFSEVEEGWHFYTSRYCLFAKKKVCIKRETDETKTKETEKKMHYVIGKFPNREKRC